MTVALTNRRDFRQNPYRQFFEGVESFEIVAQPTFRERGEPESDGGRVLRELIHLRVPR